ncbi:hypothetical protein CDD83_11216 [Cordyceps sp. RAO-2017]|nr:hypothetical protein CDD83_11216 [Cordyceps sp. RAO-2017]
MALVEDSDLKPDAIYAEAAGPGELYYEGSEDEDYPSSETRRLRYEAAGQRFLQGDIPLLLSASLRGPFHQGSGWSNPWRSKQRLQSCRDTRTTAKTRRRQIRKSSIAQTELESTASDHDCHLPSPESLRQAPASEPHPYLEQDELAMVQQWRESVKLPSLSQESFWASSNAPVAGSAKKRRAKESAWLKRVADKRRRTDSSDQRLPDSPLPQGLSGQHSSMAAQESNLPSSAHASPANLVPDNSKPDLSEAIHQPLAKDQSYEDDQDELMTTAADVSPHSASRLATSSNRRASSGREAQRSSIHLARGSAEDTDQKEAAAATLSSPVSQRYGISPADASKIGTETKGPSSLRTLRGHVSTEEDLQLRECATKAIEVDGSEEEDGRRSTLPEDVSRDLQTQHDQSFKVHHTSRANASEEPSDEEQADSPERQSESSLSADATGQPEPCLVEASKEPHATEASSTPRTKGEKSQDADQANGRVDPEAASTLSLTGLRGRAAHPYEAQETAESLRETRYKAAAGDKGVPHEQVVGAVPPGCCAGKETSLITEPETRPQDLNPRPPLDTSQVDTSHKLDTVRQGTISKREGADAATANTSAQLHSDTKRQVREVDWCESGSDASGELETRGSVSVCSDSEDNAVSAGQGTRQTREAQVDSTDGTPRDFSLKGFMNQILPTSPWKKLSQLAAGSEQQQQEKEKESAAEMASSPAMIHTPAGVSQVGEVDLGTSPSPRAGHVEETCPRTGQRTTDGSSQRRQRTPTQPDRVGDECASDGDTEMDAEDGEMDPADAEEADERRDEARITARGRMQKMRRGKQKTWR